MKHAIRNLPGMKQRVETGPVQFGDDWPGLFIRGDNCFAYMLALEKIVKDMDARNDKALIEKQQLISLIELMKCSYV